MKNFDLKLIEDSVRNILIALGEDPDRDGLVETPKRVAKMYDEVFEGMKYSNDEIAEMFSKCFIEDYDGMIIEKDIPTFSYCEHHMALMYNMNVSLAYIPKGKVIGLSKIVRIVDMVSKRLQLQERLTKDIGDIIMKSCSTDSVAVIVSGEHSCVTTRGIKKNGEKTVTTYFTGDFKNNNELRKEFLNSIGK
jgi:GTP cyclohydrolase I